MLVPLHLPARRLIVCAAADTRTRHLMQTIHAWLDQGGQPENLHVAAPHQRAAAGLRAAMDQQIEALTLRQSALALLRRFPDTAQLPGGWNETLVLSGIERRMLIGHAWAEAGADAGSLWHTRANSPGALDWVARLFDRWSTWAGSADPHQLPQPAIAGAHVAELWQAYCSYLALCRTHGLLAFSETFSRALDVLRVSDETVVPPDLLVLDDLDLLDPAEWLFVQALTGPQTAVIATSATLPGATSDDARMRALHGWIKAMQLQAEHVTANIAPASPLHEYATPDAEAEALAASIGATATGRWSDHAIVSFDAGLVPLLQRALARHNVPVEGQDARDGYTILLAAQARIGLQLLRAGGPESEGRITGIDDERWEQQAREATRRASALDRPSSQQLQYWLNALDLPRRCWERTAAALPAWAVELDQQHWQRIWEYMERAERLASTLGSSLTVDNLLEVLDAAQALVVPQGAPHTDAVQIWQASELGGCVARRVWVAGLHEHALPQTIDPLPVEDDALAGFEALRGFVAPQTIDRAAAWERGLHDLQRVLGAATDAVQLSYSRTDHQNRRRLPSLVVRDQIAEIHSQEAQALQHQAPGGTANDATFQANPSSFVLERASFSQSALEDYFVCPRRALYARQLKLYDVAAAPRQALGRIVHHALHDLVSQHGAPVDASTIAALLELHWQSDLRVWGSQLKQAVFQQLAQRALEYQARYEAEHRSVTLGNEVRFGWHLDDATTITGQIDRVVRGSDGLHIIDYKLGQSSPSLNTLLSEFIQPLAAATWRPGDVQLAVYALATDHGQLDGIERLPGERVASVAQVYPLLLYTDAGRPSATGVRRIQIVDHGDECAACDGPRSSKQAFVCRQQLAKVLDHMHTAIAQMRAQVWPADPRDGAQTCSGCPFRPICPDPR